MPLDLVDQGLPLGDFYCFFMDDLTFLVIWPASDPHHNIINIAFHSDLSLENGFLVQILCFSATTFISTLLSEREYYSLPLKPSVINLSSTCNFSSFNPEISSPTPDKPCLISSITLVILPTTVSVPFCQFHSITSYQLLEQGAKTQEVKASLVLHIECATLGNLWAACTGKQWRPHPWKYLRETWMYP